MKQTWSFENWYDYEIYIYGAMANKYFLYVVWDLMVASVEL